MQKEIILSLVFFIFLSTHGSNFKDADYIDNATRGFDGSVYDINCDTTLDVDVFYENKGQNSRTLGEYIYERNGLILGFKKNEVVVLYKGVDYVDTIRYQFLTTSEVIPSGNLPSSFDTNLFIGDNPNRWITSVQSYRELLYKDLWNRIDLRYFISKEGAKYEFIVHPGGNPSDIKVQVHGCQDLSMDDQCKLLIKTNHDIITDGPLEVFYQKDTYENIRANYLIRGSNEFGYAIDEYDLSKTIVIDPLISSTLICGIQTDNSKSISIDNDGNIIITGCTNSFDFLTTNTIGGFKDHENFNIFVMKIERNSGDILFSTIIGGSDNDFVNDHIVDDIGMVVITGSTDSQDFPTTATRNETRYESTDIFICRLSADGTNLTSSIVFGGTYEDIAFGIALAETGEAFIVGETMSEDFPITSQAYKNTLGLNNIDSFILCISSDGIRIVSSTFFGGDRTDIGFDVAIGPNKDVYICGVTGSTDFPITSDAVNRHYNTNLGTSFISKFSYNLSILRYSTYVTTNSLDFPCYLDLDKDGNIFIAGSTDSDDLPITQSAFQSVRKGASDAYICKLNVSGTSILYATYIGGDMIDIMSDFCIDNDGFTYLTGETVSRNFPTTTGILREYNAVPEDVFICVLNQNGTSLFFSSFFGGNGRDGPTGIDLDGHGNIHIVGNTNSTDLPLISKNSQDCGGKDIFVIEVDPDPYFSPISLVGGPVLYAKYQYYTFTLNGNPSKRYALPTKIELTLDPDHANPTLLWQRDTDFRNPIEKDPMDYIVSTSTSIIYGSDVMIECRVMFNWTWPHEDLSDVVLRLSWNDPEAQEVFTGRDLFRVENDLDIVGQPRVSGEWQGSLDPGDWVRAGETVTIRGLIVTYEGAEGIYPPDFSCTVNLSTGSGVWKRESMVSGEPVDISVRMVGGTVLDEVLRLSLEDLPGSAECKRVVTYALNVDGDLPSLLNPTPTSGEWHSEASVLCSIIATDEGAGVDIGTLEYAISTESSERFGDWSQDGLRTSPDGNSIDAMVLIPLREGRDNYIRWRVMDRVGNGPVISDTIRVMVDTTRITFSDPYPSPESWFNVTEVVHGCVISDVNGSGVRVDSVQYRIAHGTPSHYSEWSYWDVASDNVVGRLEVSMEIALADSPLNFVQWRAKDIASDVYINSPSYEYRVDLSPPELIDITPGSNIRLFRTEVTTIAHFEDALSGIQGEYWYRYKCHGTHVYSEWIVSTSMTEDMGYLVVLNLTRGDGNEIQFMAFDIAGNFNVSEVHVIYINRLPVPVITRPKAGTEYPDMTRIALDASSTYDEDGDLVNFRWYIDDLDGLISILDRDNITLEPGHHTVILVVSDSFDGVNQTSVSILVKEPPPVFQISDEHWLIIVVLALIAVILILIYRTYRNTVR